MKIRFDICGDGGWQTIVATAPDGSGRDIPSRISRWDYWRDQTGYPLPSGKVMVWEPVHEA